MVQEGLGPAASVGRLSLLIGDWIIARHRSKPVRRDTGKRLRINDFIRVPQVRLIDENDSQVGVINTDEAKRMARDAGLDLVEVAPQSQPPVCRIMDYGKWKYQQRKKEQKARSHAKASELKEVRLRPKIDDHDLSIKVNKARQFLEGNDKVQFTMLFRGREMAHRDIGLKIMQDVAETLKDTSKVETMPRQMGRRMTMVLSPDARPAQQKKKESGEQAPKAEQPAAPKAEQPAAPGAAADAKQPTPAPPAQQ